LKKILFTVLLTFLLSAEANENKCKVWPDWDNFRSHFISESGRVVDNSTSKMVTTSEGQSYALMFSLIANDRPSFDLILRWTEDNLANGDLTSQLPAWQWGKREDGNWGVIDSNAASDADLWTVYALSEAGRLWKTPKYTALAELLADRILREETAQLPGLGRTLLPGPKGFHPDEITWKLNPSYLPIQLIRHLADIYPKSDWKQLIATSIKVITQSAPQGFSPEWSTYKAGSEFQTDNTILSEGSFNAIRVYLWAGMLDNHDPAASDLLKKLAAMGKLVANSGNPPREINIFNGAVKESGSAGFSAALLPFLKSSRMSEALRQQQLRVTALAPLEHNDNYYDQVLTLFGQGWLQGHYRFARDGSLKPRWICIKD
jgi:endoglucanase